MKFYIYHIAPKGVEDLNEGYIGVSVDPKRRWIQHQAKVRNGSGYNVYDFIRKTGGIDSVEFRVVEEYDTEEAVYDRENELRPEPYMGWNESIGGICASMGAPVEYEGVRYSSVAGMARELGIDPKTAKRMLEGKPVFQTHTEYNVSKKPVTIRDAKTNEEQSFDSLKDAWDWIGKQGNVNGNVAKQTKKGRPAYGYYWTY